MARTRSEIQERRQIDPFAVDPGPMIARPASFDACRFDENREIQADAKERRMERRNERIDVLKDAHRTKATRLLARIPDPGVSVHMLTNGAYDFWDFIAATLALRRPHKVSRFYGSTWIINRQNARDLIALYDAGDIATIGIITGIYFKRREGAVFNLLYEGLRTRGQRFAAAKNHSKWFAALFDDGVALVAEGSANFCENGNTEQVVITHDRALFDYYASFAEEVLGTDPLPPLDAPPPPPPPLREANELPPPRQARRRRTAALASGGIGAYVATRDHGDRGAIKAWKLNPPPCPRYADLFAAAIAQAVREASPILPAGAIVTTPPPGASAERAEYPAAMLAHRVAARLDLPHVETMERTDTKDAHGWRAARAQAAYRIRSNALATPPPMAIVIDDIATTGTTIKLARDALAAAGIPSVAVAYSGR